MPSAALHSMDWQTAAAGGAPAGGASSLGGYAGYQANVVSFSIVLLILLLQGA